ncbi:MAG: DUF1501 domain-containing protein [Lautropia sp.]
MSLSNASRRRFLRTASALGGVLPAAGSGFALNLASIGAAAAQAAPGDYKALVCVFLFGGCDYANTVLATDPESWGAYLAARGAPPDPIALDLPEAASARSVLSVVPASAATLHAGRSFGLHPNLEPIRALFAARRAAVVANVGPLIVPTTPAQFRAKSVPLPTSLFSHNDQQSTWMAFGPEGSRSGWGGRLGDLFAAANPTPAFTCISAGGNAVFLNGESVTQYQVGSSGAVGINGVGSLYGIAAAPKAVRATVTEARSHLMERELNRIASRAIDTGAALNTAIASSPSFATIPAGNGLASQLQVVAKIIGGRASTGAKRQVFMVATGGFDTHDNLVATHGAKMTEVADAIAWFDGAMDSIGAGGAVTLFTASDFGRTLTSNGDGSDHGWGSHHFVVGGAVRGGDVYGAFPTIGVNAASDVGSGRLVPGIAVDQYAATMAKWFGLSDTHLLDVMPNLRAFASRDLGFMT